MKVSPKKKYEGPELPAMQPLVVEIIEPVEYIEDEFKGKKTEKAKIVMRVVEPEEYAEAEAKVWGRHGTTYTSMKDGTKSKLRQLVEAFVGSEMSDEELADFELDDLYVKDEKKRTRFQLIGTYKPDDDDHQYLTPIAYMALRAAKKPTGKAAGAPPPPPGSAPPPPPPSAPPAPKYEQISDDGKWGWDGSEWQEIKAAGPPPPPSSNGAPVEAGSSKKVNF